MDLWEFLTVLVLTFALFMLVAGVFTAYFGSGKSRMIGIVLLVVGLVVGVIWVYGAMWGGGDYIPLPEDVHISDVIWNAFVYIIAAVIGALIAIGAFLLAIMKS
ncbi:MAG: hypothetical protein HPY73_04970 [Methanomassiliicoccales archaeon]|nr:MAG: hypothetical protein HPY73_04970 [Methanomassiliicoccales archaeon]